MKRCKFCGKNIKNNTRKIYCNSKCRDKYRYHFGIRKNTIKKYLQSERGKETHRKSSKKYYQKHKKEILEKFKIYGDKYRHKNKDKIRKYFVKNRKKLLKKKKEYYQKHKEKFKKNNIKNRDKIKAHSLARKIKIPRGTLCCVCEREKAIDKHHEDYDKPLEVGFCCRGCHRELDYQRQAREQN